ncbi:hypothetical protein DBV05_g5003 [Lasiodiplodia theobromae]|uniref:DUF7605 domain-containing protein n=1 Tax=Lasiodiplodia theobromae TaxID=45133 RepID=A0A5N5DFE4_9PEZI|nr:hypothetical protein DBV05_g5003 [Lasiodiplodia theobromae]
MMDINSTNIPALQAFLCALPAFRRFKAFENRHERELPWLLDHLAWACSPIKIDGTEELHEILLSTSGTVAPDISNSFKKFFDEAIVPGIATIKTNKAAYATYATDKLREWSYWHNQTYKTFCIHRGNWRTQKVGRRDWNEEMLELLVQDVDRETNGWEDAMSDLTKIISAKLDAKISKLIAELHGANRSSTASMNLFVRLVQNEQTRLKERCRARVEKLQSDLMTIKQRVTDTQDMEQSYFVRSLEKTYDDCSRMSGSSSHTRRTEALRSKISKKVRDPFSEMFDLANKDAEKVI